MPFLLERLLPPSVCTPFDFFSSSSTFSGPLSLLLVGLVIYDFFGMLFFLGINCILMFFFTYLVDTTFEYVRILYTSQVRTYVHI